MPTSVHSSHTNHDGDRVCTAWLWLCTLQVSGDSFAGCFYQLSEPWKRVLAWCYAYFFLLATTVLMLNMLIAMMASACDVAAALDAACGLDLSTRTLADTG